MRRAKAYSSSDSVV